MRWRRSCWPIRLSCPTPSNPTHPRGSLARTRCRKPSASATSRATVCRSARDFAAATCWVPQAVRIVTSPQAMQRQALRWRRAGRRVVFVPTMGALHEGHLSLMRRARTLAGPRGMVVASVFVNPLQFNNARDLSVYPRPLAHDRRLCRDAGVDVFFAPAAGSMRAADAGTWVEEMTVSRSMEGVVRPGHFRGVTTVVLQLFNLVQPSIAIFGAKDFQQAAIIQRMVRDLSIPVRIVVAPTIREADGLAMSSRNVHLTPVQRGQATALWQAMGEARVALRGGVCVAGRKLDALRRRLVRRMESHPDVRVEYVEFFDEHTLEPVRQIQRGARTRMAVAAWVGQTRLIDNARL
ncbi:MAG: pantoate--beta-alanine ligase [Pedosphaera sp.]|nr:pantoate--beta-alanine ligase [Pedosphaera sp.]